MKSVETREQWQPRKETRRFKIGKVDLNVAIEEIPGDTKHLAVTDLTLQNETGQTQSVLELVPANWKIVLADIPTNQGGADFLERQLRLPKFHMRDKQTRIPENQEMPVPAHEEEESIIGRIFYDRRAVARNQYRVVDELWVEPYFANPHALVTLFHELGHAKHPNNQNMPEDYNERDKYLLLRPKTEAGTLEEERDVSAFALNQVRQLKRKGFDLGPNFSLKALKDEMKWPLSSYHDPKQK